MKAGGLIVYAFALCFLFQPFGFGEEARREVKRIAYFEVGPYWIFRHEFQAFREELAKSDAIDARYPPDLHISPGWNTPSEELEKIAAALQKRDDIDLLLVAGTAAVRAVLKTNTGRIPIIGMDLTDPVGTGLVAGPEDSGVDNFTCDVPRNRWGGLFSVFHDIVKFSKLGIMYPATSEGRVTSLIAEAEEVGRGAGFSVLARELPGEETPDCMEGLKWLNENGADAFFIGSLNCFDWEQSDPEPLYELLNDTYRMPTFAWDGSYQVRAGALTGFTMWNYSRAGAVNAGKAMEIFEGASPRSLSMYREFTPLLVVNVETALKLNIDLPFDILVAADEIYMESKRPSMQ